MGEANDQTLFELIRNGEEPRVFYLVGEGAGWEVGTGKAISTVSIKGPFLIRPDGGGKQEEAYFVWDKVFLDREGAELRANALSE